MVDADRAELLVAAGAVLLVATLAVSAAAAPSLGVENGGANRTLVGMQGGGPGWHEGGSVFLLEGSEERWREDSANSYFDVTGRADGTVLAGFMHGGYEDCGPYESPCVHTGFRVIDPSGSPEVTFEYGFPVRSRKNSEVHDVEALPTGEFLVTDMDAERIFTVNRDGEETWEWRAESFYDAPDDPTRTDWLHINDVDVIDEGRFLVSVRNANQLVIVDREEGVVEVINEDRDDADDDACRLENRGQSARQLADYDGDGDIRCGDPDVLDHQHNPQWLGDGAVLVADSDNHRVVELHRTESGEWTVAWSVERVGGVALNWPRDADRLANGHTLITDTLNRRIVELDAEGEVVWSTQTRLIPYEADRLPDGELVGAPRADGEPGDPEAPGGDVPLLSDGLILLRAVVPGVPFWFRELQLALTLVSVGLAVAGLVDRNRA
ncbi:MAG: aryl-sulfate sulfotransferase [Halobacteriales archaeon]|nr:aryl-sulfate sulfotransferase [Halobacteriales archaeon]